ncbi:MAG TPA: ABC transporter permease [Kineosporiaceae bacterium]|nr:ABC transporter permease [Kineosporiaceae bacterium]
MTTDKTTGPAQTTRPTETAQADFARDAGASTAIEFVRDYISRVRGGEVGALPAVLGLVVLVLVFSQASDRFLTVYNLANLVSQAGITVFIAMGLVFVLLLGEIDLAAGTASGVCAGIMGLALVHQGDLQKALGTPVFVTVIVFMLLAIGVAVLSRLWIPAAMVGLGVVMAVLHLFTSSAVGAIYLAVAGGISIGLLTGFLVAWVGIPSFVVTLALFLGWQGVILQMVGDGGAISVRQFDLINGIANKNLAPALGWLFFAVLIGIYTLYTVYRSIQRRGQGLSAEPMVIVLSRAGGLAVIGAIGLFFLNQERSPNPDSTSIKGAPYVLPLIIVFMIGWTLILSKTRFGRYVYAVGGNAEAARRAGVDLRRIRMSAFAIGSGMAALGGVVQASRLGSIPSDAGGGNTLLFAVAAAVIGGTSLFGGKGRARDAVIGGLVIATIPNGLGLLSNLPASTQFVITCLVLLVAASVDALSRKRASASGR